MALALYRKYRPAHLRRGHRAGARHRAADAGAAQRPAQPRLPVLRPARLRQDLVSARILARSLNCEQGPDARPVRRVRLLRRAGPRRPRLASTSSRSTRPATAASTTPVTCASGRSSRRSASRYKVYIIDEAHMVTHAGLQRPAQAGRGAAGATSSSSSPPPSRRRCSARSGRAPTTTRSGWSRRACCGRTWSSSAQAEGVTVEPAVLPAGGARRRRLGPGLAVGPRPAARRRRPGGRHLRAGGRAARRHRRRRCSTRWSTRSPPATARPRSRPSTGWSRPGTTRAGSPPTCWSGCAT